MTSWEMQGVSCFFLYSKNLTSRGMSGILCSTHPPRLSTMRTPAGIFMSNNDMQNYCKPALTIDQQLDLLASRGLNIPDRDKARHYLNYIGYHRLSGYFLIKATTERDRTPSRMTSLSKTFWTPISLTGNCGSLSWMPSNGLKWHSGPAFQTP